MRVLGANFLIDYLNGHPAAERYYESNGGDTDLWMMSAPADAETLVGVGNRSSGDVEEAIDALSWGGVYKESSASPTGFRKPQVFGFRKSLICVNTVPVGEARHNTNF